MFHTWLVNKEGIWLFYVLLTSVALEAATYWILIKEYRYDEQKDLAKKQRRTKTTKKTTTQPGGASVIEESVETVEPTGEQK